MTLNDTPVIMNEGFGNCWVWIILLFFLIGGNGGVWNNNTAAEMAAAKTQASVWQSNDQQNLMGAIAQVRDGNIALGNGICDATFALNNNVQAGFTNAMRDNFGLQRDVLITGNNLQAEIAGVGYNAELQGLRNTNTLGQAINQNRFDMATGFCNTNHNISDIKYENALNTNRITDNNMILTQKVLDRIDRLENNAKDTEIANLRQQVAAASLANSQYLQNAQLIQALRPYPNPAYLVGNPIVPNVCPCAA